MDSATANKQLIDQLPKIAHRPDQLETLLDAASFRERLLHEIAQAKSRIYLVALYLQDDEAGRSILDALYEAKQKNPVLDIKVLVDWHRAQRGLIGAEKSDGNAALYREYSEKYTYKVDVLGVPVRNREVFGVLHLKGFIIDDTVIYSGASLNDVYLAQHDRYRYDRYHVIKSKALADCMANFIGTKLVSSDAVTCLSQPSRPNTKVLKPAIRDLRARLQSASYSFISQHINADQVGLTPMVGLGKRKNFLNTQICRLIACAHEDLTICTPYFNPPRSVMREIRRALRRGVNVTIIVGDKTANDFYIPPDEPFRTISGLPYLYEINLRNFARRNEAAIAKRQLRIHLWKHDDNSFHLKGIWVDRSYMLLTGNNLNPRAWKLDLENAILLHDKNRLLEDEMQREIDTILSHTQLIGSYKQIEKLEVYPAQVRKLLKRIKRIRADHLLNQIL
ncbi:phosphatidylserine synthase [Enterovibrio norvegicus FF-33]|uniref:Phosphatidylserine synthase n=1 Tax=Enterovibrio norvegicus FF-454 TaxID=1185651 RepID=A0A1E5CCR4_9GAMM|nr:CDP-diacylglycerol--serine O-phosphatidyltransferase [Enterovibrio norvegicus]OEE63255.1 phosphatidylserine synthase [Enterovibrio norvegicus FF-454]OEE64762.1 phosphatidylserine synthase [Enterovibrio norvegicus FF-33]OEE87839.1 phosphatidylserine synthase [Enterovibrio norvegicus FF-162]